MQKNEKMAKHCMCQEIFLLFVYLKKKKSYQGHQGCITHWQLSGGCNCLFLSKDRASTKTSSGGKRQSLTCKWCEHRDGKTVHGRGF